MPTKSTSIIINRSCEAVFDLIHDYDQRLEWDTLLRQAYLLDGAEKADKGVKSICTGKWSVGGLAFETVYISFIRGRVAAIKLTNKPPFFGTFAATLKHEPLMNDQSRVTYIYHFKARPRALSWLLEPIINRLFHYEIKMRLNALKGYLERHKQ